MRLFAKKPYLPRDMEPILYQLRFPRKRINGSSNYSLLPSKFRLISEKEGGEIYSIRHDRRKKLYVAHVLPMDEKGTSYKAETQEYLTKKLRYQIHLALINPLLRAIFGNAHNYFFEEKLREKLRAEYIENVVYLGAGNDDFLNKFLLDTVILNDVALSPLLRHAPYKANTVLLDVKDVYSIKYSAYNSWNTQLVIMKNIIHHLLTQDGEERLTQLFHDILSQGFQLMILEILDPSKKPIPLVVNLYYRLWLGDQGDVFLTGPNELVPLIENANGKITEMEIIKAGKGDYLYLYVKPVKY